MRHPTKKSLGFSLVLSLTVMAGIVLLVLSIAAFTSIESRLAMQHHLFTRAKLNAVAAMRMAVGHLQQEAGADRRSTARGDITQPSAPASTILNPMWTGVWRTDFPDLPPAWLVSGRADQPPGTQSVSLFQTALIPDYPIGYWAPWQNSYSPPTESLVELVGKGTAAASDGVNPSGLVSLPKISLPDTDINGSYAYWVGDEGVKARVNLNDTRSVTTGNTDQALALRSPMMHGLARSLSKPEQLLALEKISEAPMLQDFGSVIPGGGSTDLRPFYHDVSFVAAGVLADSLNGGLKRDLSLAFELSDSQFALSELGQGATGAAGTHTEKGFAATFMPVMPDNGGRELSAAPIFSRTVNQGQLRGPTWWALRDYHRLYKQIGWTAAGTGPRSMGTPTLRARALWPNVAAAHPSGTPASSGLPNNSLRNRIYGYSDIYDSNLPTPINPNATDYQGGNTGRIITRPLNVAATPYVQRVTLAFSVNKMQWFVWKTIRVGKNVMWYQEEWVDIRLNITPIVVIHNPYNVRMTWQPGATPNSPNRKPYAAALSFADLANWKFRLKQYPYGSTSNPAVLETPLSTIFGLKSAASDNEDTFRLYLTKDTSETITLEPGELRVFSCQPVSGEWTKSIVLDNAYDTRGGYYNYDWLNVFSQTDTDAIDITAPIAFEIIPGGSMRMRHAITSWPTDQIILDTSPSINAAADKNDFFYKSSEVSEVVYTDINAVKYPSPGEKFFASWRHVRDKYDRPDAQYDGRLLPPPPLSQYPLEPDLVTVIDITAKTADETAAPYPTFTHSNPLAATQRASASGRVGSGSDNGIKGTSPSYQLNVRSGTWLNVLSNSDSGRLAYGGNTTNTAGSQRVILTEIPLGQPTSLAQYTHANFGVRDQQPLLSIGNSFASPLVSATKTFQDNGANWTEFDQSFLLNTALWDGFFLSSLGPWMNTGNNGAVAPTAPMPVDLTPSTTVTTAPNETKLLTKVISDFIDNGVPLDNPRFSIERAGLSTQATAAALADYRRSASVLLNKGAFNVNSTSVVAWQSLLGLAKNMAISDQPADQNARFPRTLTPGTTALASGNLDILSNWAGFANISDGQIANLAKAIVDENKARFGVLTRTERDLAKAPGNRLFGGLTKAATPYLGLSEFINRFLSTETWASRCGALQSAILRADQTYNTGLSDRLFANAINRKITTNSLVTPTAGTFPNPENIEVIAQGGTSRTHTAMGAPGNLLQSDLLQSLGSALASRSDTFTIRCYGEASQRDGATGSAWVEAVVQRVPQFIDATNPAETGNSAPRPLIIGPSAATDPTVSTALTAVNNLLGRRFKIISLRWLQANEI